MYKKITLEPFILDEPTINLIDFSNKEGLIKKAADSRITEFVNTIQPKPGYFYLHILAMTAGEYYGSNRNQDFFPGDNLVRYYKTFETNPAKLFRHHKNKAYDDSYGHVIFSIYNERMHRVELVVEADSSVAGDIEQRIAAGDYPSTSMACRTPYDTCSICGNKAKSRQAYCEHLKFELGKVYPDGRKVMAINDAALSFFDISIVIRPADVTSSILAKVASEEDDTVIGSAQAAEEDGLVEGDSTGPEKRAFEEKISELIKEIPEGTVASSTSYLKLLGQVRDPADDLLTALAVLPFGKVCAAFAELGISPSIRFLAELLARNLIGDEGKGLGEPASNLASIIGLAKLPYPDVKHLVDFGEPDEDLIKHIADQAFTSSLLPEYIQKRASDSAFISYSRKIDSIPREGIYTNSIGTGFAHLQGHEVVLKSPNDALEELRGHLVNPESASSFKALLSVGAGAVLAKLLITEYMKEKLRNMTRKDAKIQVVKQASDYGLASNLSQASLQNELNNRSASDMAKNSTVKFLNKALTVTDVKPLRSVARVISLTNTADKLLSNVTSS